MLISPQSNSLISTSTADHPAIRSPIYSEHLVLVSREVYRQLVRAHVPDFEGSVSGARNKKSRIC